MDSRLKTRKITPQQINDVQHEIVSFLASINSVVKSLAALTETFKKHELTKEEFISQYKVIDSEGVVCPSNDIFSKVLGVRASDFHSTEALENAVLQYAVLLGGDECKTLSTDLNVDGHASYSHQTKEKTFTIQYRNLSAVQVKEMADIFKEHYSGINIVVTTSPPASLVFDLSRFYQDIIMDMLINPTFQNLYKNLLAQKDQAQKFHPLWNPEIVRAETNVDNLFNLPKRSGFFSSLSVEEREAKAIREQIKDGSNLHVYRILFEARKSLQSAEIRNRVDFALEKMKDIKPLFMRKKASENEEKSAYRLKA